MTLLHSSRALASARAFGLLAALLLATASHPGLGLASAGAQGKAAEKASAQSGEILVILAAEGEGHVDPELKKMEALQKPPFNGFKSMKVLSKQKLSLSASKPVTADLPNGRRMQIEMLEVAKDGRYKVRVSINKPDTKDYLPGMVVAASAGEPFFVAGQKHEGGTLVIGIRVGERSKASKGKP